MKQKEDAPTRCASTLTVADWTACCQGASGHIGEHLSELEDGVMRWDTEAQDD